MSFLPITMDEMKVLGWDTADFVLVTGDAYVDHPSFGAAIIGRVLEAEGFRVAVLAQPDWKDPKAFARLGKPNLAFLVTGGNVDSMVAHYSVAGNRRRVDHYSPGDKMGLRPDRAVTVYSSQIRKFYGADMPIILGGLEASLRRFAHYDYWANRVLPSILQDSKADLLVYGMGELQIRELAKRLSQNESVHSIQDVPGTCYLAEPKDTPMGCKECPSLTQVCESQKSYAKATKIQVQQQDQVYGRRLTQRQTDRILVQNPPMRALTREEFDAVYALPYMRDYHPSYQASGGVAAIQEVAFSIIHNRGCFGDCNFCAITLHQGRRVVSRSRDSVLKEAKLLTENPGFKGHIHDVGGPTANFREPSCDKQLTQGLCIGRKCLAPEPCPNLQADHSEYLKILQEMRALPNVKKVFIRSGIRYDYLLAEKQDSGFMKELVEHHVSGQLKVAPEHCVDSVLDYMGKPHISTFLQFRDCYYKTTKQLGKEQYLIPYLISSHPGCRLTDAVALAEFLQKHHIRPEQVQDFYPTPGTISTCMFYTGLDPMTMEEVYIPRNREEKEMQRALLQYYLPKNQVFVKNALYQTKRTDLFGKLVSKETAWPKQATKGKPKRKRR